MQYMQSSLKNEEKVDILSDRICRLCTESLLNWYRSHSRALPWRISPTPYRVWISEIMLQQTRIEAVIPYFRRFMDRLPSVPDLAAVSDEELLKLWEGLGYYNRARNLKRAAVLLCDKFDGNLPADYEQLLSLPGVGEYTAGAIASIAFNIPVPAVDGNVMRVLSRLTGDETDVLSAEAKRHYRSVVIRYLSNDDPGRFNQAIMELGETICLPNAVPQCGQCPLLPWCVGYGADMTDRLPVRRKQKKRRIEERVVDIIVFSGDPPRVLIRKRQEKGLLAGLWEFPNRLVNEDDSLPFVSGSGTDLPVCKHIFTHVEWHMTGKLYLCALPSRLPKGTKAVTLSELSEQFPLPSAFHSYTALLPELIGKDRMKQ